MRQFAYILFFSLISLLGAEAQQSSLARLNKANQLYAAKQYGKALEKYEALLNSSRSSAVVGVDARINMADCYRALGQPYKANTLYKELMDYSSSRPEIHLQYGEVLMLLGRYEEAKSQFARYSDYRPEDPRAQLLLKRCEDIQAIRPLYPDAQLVLDSTVSDSMTDEFGLAYYGENTIVYSSDRIAPGNVLGDWAQRSYLNIYISEIGEEGKLLNSKLFAQRLNASRKHNGPATFSRDGKTVYFSQSAEAVDPNMPADEISLYIMVSRLEDDQWTNPEPLPFNQEGKICTHPTLSADGTMLVFSSNIGGGYGGMDLWMSMYKDGRWTNPRNLGEQINSDGNEGFPYLHPNGNLYFASKGLSGYGGYDLFRALPAGNGLDWVNPENMGQPINSGSDDTYFLLSDDETRGYVSSARLGSDDIFHFQIQGAEPKELAEGVLPRGSTDFIDGPELVAERIKKDEEEVDEILASGLNPNATSEPVKTDGEPKNTDGSESTEIDENIAGTNPQPGQGKTGEGAKAVVAIDENTNLSGENPTDTNPNTAPSGESARGSTELQPAGQEGGKPTVNPMPEANPELRLALTLVDAENNTPLANIEVQLIPQRGETRSFRTDNAGTVLIELKPEAEYSIRAENTGYYGGSLPISTVGVRSSQSAAAKLPLYRRENN